VSGYVCICVQRGIECVWYFFFFAFHFISNFNTAELCVTATDTHTNRQQQYKGNNSISFQICPLIGVTKNKYNTEYIQYVLFIGIFRQHIMGYILLYLRYLKIKKKLQRVCNFRLYTTWCNGYGACLL
jgi:hypothetical protein